ncbi:MAG: CRISPR-associated protein Cas5 [Bacteroidota bacterium]
MKTMEAIRVEMEGDMTSFRYPHFLVGRQPSYPVPPPATIYGHLCSAFGEYVDPSGLYFAYTFTTAGHGDDLENLYMTTLGSGKPTRAWSEPENIQLFLQPTLRELLIKPSMILYVVGGPGCQAWYEALRSPKYTVILGRSQDLMSYRSVKAITLQESEDGYFDNALLSIEAGLRTTAGITYRLPRFIQPENRRAVSWGDYLVVRGRIRIADENGPVTYKRRAGEKYWVDPESPEIESGSHRIVAWQSFVGESILNAS